MRIGRFISAFFFLTFSCGFQYLLFFREKRTIRVLCAIPMAHRVTIYSTPPCPFCQLAKEYFAENNIPFTDINVQEDEKGREKMIAKSHQLGVPVIEIDGEIVIGFQKDKIAQLLAQ